MRAGRRQGGWRLLHSPDASEKGQRLVPQAGAAPHQLSPGFQHHRLGIRGFGYNKIRY